jgi:hypothetical protein
VNATRIKLAETRHDRFAVVGQNDLHVNLSHGGFLSVALLTAQGLPIKVLVIDIRSTQSSYHLPAFADGKCNRLGWLFQTLQVLA